MKLLVVESPSKAKTIQKYLGNDYKVLSSVGHIRDIPKSEKNAIDIENGFMPNYHIIKGKEKVIAALKNEVKQTKEVLLATDPDREGEAIAWHIKEVLNLKNAKRISFNEVTKDAILAAIDNPRNIDDGLRQAQEARRVLDRLFGYTLSKLIWKKVRYGLSAGRVQSPALRILMEREREIRAFVGKKYYILSITFSNNNKVYDAICENEISDKKLADYIAENSKSANWIISEIKNTRVKRSPKAPFITSTLQQAANSKLLFSVSRVMRVAQKLYEDGLITYIRTDGVSFGETAHKQIKKLIENEYGKDFYLNTIYKSKRKNSQEAHEAIRPTDISKVITGRTQDEMLLYELIRERTIASQMRPSVFERSVVYFKSDDKKIPRFVIRGIKIIDKGWLAASPSSSGDEIEIPNLKKSTKFKCDNIISTEKETTPPNRYSEAGLVKDLEMREIGRPSTYASIIRTLIERKYVTKEGRTLIPTELGDTVSTFIEKHFSKYIDDVFTAKMENQLDNLATQKEKYVNVISNFYKPFVKDINSKENIEKLTNIRDADKKFKCPKCDAKMVIKLSKTGTFMSCQKFPKCMGSRTDEGKEIEEPKEINKDCPKCPNGRLVLKMGKFGKFVSCNKYPKCKYIEDDEETVKLTDTGISCPTCNKGIIREKRGKFGPFYACSEYPNCKFSMKSKPITSYCPLCSCLMMEGTKTIPNRCSDKVCPMHNPQKLK